MDAHTRDALTLFGAAALWHAAWVAVAPTAEYADAFYYDAVARSIVGGEGAVSGAVWNLQHLPDAIPFPADLHWMPGPSRWATPFVALWPAGGALVAGVLAAATWAPLAFLLARALGADRTACLLAGGFALLGGEAVRDAALPDSFGLAGALGGLAFLACARDRPWLVALAAGGLALTRNDGILLLPFLAVALGRRGWPVLLAALPWAGWTVRNRLLGGPGYLEARAASTTAVDITDVVLGVATPGLHLAERLAAVGSYATLAVLAVLGAGVFVLPLAAASGFQRRERWVRAGLAAWLVLPVVALVVAPGAAVNGTIQRTGAVFFPLICALAAPALLAGGAWAARVRGYPRWLVPGAAVLIVVVGVLGAGARKVARVDEWTADDCTLLVDVPPGEVVFAWKPLYTWRHCGRPAVVLPQGLTPERATAIADRYGIRWALAASPARTDAVLARPEHVPAILPGWVRVNDRVWRRPD